MGQQPVQSRNAHIVEPHDAAAVDLGGHRRLLRDRDVRRAARRDDDRAGANRLRNLAHNAELRLRAVIERDGLFDFRRRLG